ncbi:MAG: signal peptidase I [Hyphomicrobiales bacterium]|nr:signal peptidase I [Hyphomicrobiales bacterium]
MSQTEKAKPAKSEGGFWGGARVIIEALAIALVLRIVLFQTNNIPSGSMIPTLLVGDYVIVTKYPYGYSRYSIPFGPPLFNGRILSSPAKRGDVVVFKLPSDNSTDYIKRVIGLPGDKVQMKAGRLYINGEMVPREPLPKVRTRDLYGKDIDAPAYMETLPGGVKHMIVEIQGDDGYNDNTGVYEVPPNNYFMMGDNRDNSSDSRIPPEQGGVGFVPFENFEGRAERIYFSVNDDSALNFWRWPQTLRLDRILKPAH